MLFGVQRCWQADDGGNAMGDRRRRRWRWRPMNTQMRAVCLPSARSGVWYLFVSFCLDGFLCSTWVVHIYSTQLKGRQSQESERERGIVHTNQHISTTFDFCESNLFPTGESPHRRTHNMQTPFSPQVFQFVIILYTRHTRHKTQTYSQL